MGKWEEDPPSTTVTHSQSTLHPDNHCSRIARLFRFRCIFVLVLGLSVLFSALFWLPPFFNRRDRGDLDLHSPYKGHDIVATFMVQKPLSLLKDDLPQLEGYIFDEIRVPTTKVVILKAEDAEILNTTKVIFGVDHDESNSEISSYAKSLVRDSFVYLVLHQSALSLTDSLSVVSSSFEVLKFVGGITVAPDQSAYPLQKVQIRFNFTLNFSIQQILDHFGELTSQLKSGLHLAPYENLHVSLTNKKGSTVDPQTTVQSSIVLAVGTPSMARSKQLAQTIKGSPTKNLGLNNTQFGRVKQISLSSFYNGSSGGKGTPTPSPAPLPHPPPQRHHNHHHDKQLPPAKPPSPSKHSLPLPPVPTPAPHKIHNAKPPDCHSGDNWRKRNANKHPPLYPPASQPVLPPHIPPPPLRRTLPPPPPPRLPPPPPPPRLPPPPPPQLPPPPQPLSPPPPSIRPPPPPISFPPPSTRVPPPPPVPETIPASSPLPNVVFAGTHSHPPSKSDFEADPPDTTPSGSVLQPSSAASVGVSSWAIPTFLVIIILETNMFRVIPLN